MSNSTNSASARESANGLHRLDPASAGTGAYELATELFPICRSITGPGVRQTLGIIQRELPELAIVEVPSGTKCFDWVVPDEWTINEAFVERSDGVRVIDFASNNLHVVNYSRPIDAILSLEDLQPYLHSIPEMPDAVPYVTSYYNERWGFCLSHTARKALKPGKYRVKIDSRIDSGSLTYGEIILAGSSNKEVFLSSDVGRIMPSAITRVNIFSRYAYQIVTEIARARFKDAAEWRSSGECCPRPLRSPRRTRR